MEDQINSLAQLLAAPTSFSASFLSLFIALLSLAASGVGYGGSWLIRRRQRRFERTLREYERALEASATQVHREDGLVVNFQINKAPTPGPDRPKPPLISAVTLWRWIAWGILTMVLLGITILLPYALKAVAVLVGPPPPVVGLLLGLAAGVALYWFREKAQIRYGALECVAGGLAIWLVVNQIPGATPSADLAQVGGFAAGVYVIVRGIDNMVKGGLLTLVDKLRRP